jgi:hypothetical protein
LVIFSRPEDPTLFRIIWSPEDPTSGRIVRPLTFFCQDFQEKFEQGLFTPPPSRPSVGPFTHRRGRDDDQLEAEGVTGPAGSARRAPELRRAHGVVRVAGHGGACACARKCDLIVPYQRVRVVEHCRPPWQCALAMARVTISSSPASASEEKTGTFTVEKLTNLRNGTFDHGVLAGRILCFCRYRQSCCACAGRDFAIL